MNPRLLVACVLGWLAFGCQAGFDAAQTHSPLVSAIEAVGPGTTGPSTNPGELSLPVEAPEDGDLDTAPASGRVPGAVPKSGEDREQEIVVVKQGDESSRRRGTTTNALMRLPVGSSTSRDFTAVIDLTPTASRGAAGISLAGTTGAETKYSVEGAEATNPSYGMVDAAIVREFVEEVVVRESGYEAKYGGAGGGQVEARRVHGMNWFRAEVGVRVTPRVANPRLVTATDESVRALEVNDIGAELFAVVSGPIAQDRLFYTFGITPGGTRSRLVQSFHHRVDKDGSGTFEGCPNQPGANDCVDGADYITTEKFAEQSFKTGVFRFSYVAGLDWLITPRHTLAATVQGGPRFDRRSFRLPHAFEPNAFGGNPSTDPLTGASRVASGIVNDHLGVSSSHTTLASLLYTGRVLDDDVEIEAGLSFSQFAFEDAWRLDNPELRGITATQTQTNAGQDLYGLLDRDDALALVPGVREACNSGEVGGLACPTRVWRSGGLGEYDRDVSRRVGAKLGLTHYVEWLGLHEIAWGVGLDWTQRHATFRYSGSNGADFGAGSCEPGEVSKGEACFDPASGEYRVPSSPRVNNNRLVLINGEDPSVHLTRGFGTARHELEDTGAVVDANGQGVRAAAYDETLSSINYALYLQDRWSIKPNLYIDAGLRWEVQDLRDIYAKSQVLIWDNVAPRLGISYDWTDEGRSRLYANYGHYYQPLPLQLNSRTFGGLVNVGRSYARDDCVGQVSSLDGVSHPRSNAQDQPSEWCVDSPSFTTGLMQGVVVPRLRGQFNRQFQVGYEQEVAEDLVIGFRWLHSGLGRAVEDVSTNGGLDFVLANPGVGVAQRHVDAQRSQCEALTTRLDALEPGTREDGSRQQLTQELARCEFAAEAYALVGTTFRKPSRRFDALSVSVIRRFNDNWLLLASYTYTRLVGNYDGYVDPISGANNIGASSQYDLPELVVNSHGPLAGSIPHRFKLDASYIIDLRHNGSLVLGTSFRVQSGIPISLRVDSTHDSYRGAYVNYLLPRGVAGRAPPNYQWNTSVGYVYSLPHDIDLSFSTRILNITNAKSTLRVDEVYSFDKARPIAGGEFDDLAHAKGSGNDDFYGRDIIRPQANFGVPTRFQQPIAIQFELKLDF